MSTNRDMAFPQGTFGGMMLRDYFAAAALPAVMVEYFRGNGTCLGTDHAPRNCVGHAYAYADAMLKAREDAK